ncbi:MAG: 4Fe-4S binding protein [Firmicutes bacterium]|nr:4Fe-4S binding protein [Bacillota bacterium]
MPVYEIDRERCSACGLCADVCPVEAISQFGEYRIDPDKCVCCGLCQESCPSEAVVRHE